MKIVIQSILSIVLFFHVPELKAQQKAGLRKDILSTTISPSANSAAKKEAPVVRCLTTEYYKKRFETDPVFKSRFEKNQSQLQKLLANKAQTQSRAANVSDTIPIVIHVVGNAAMQAKVTDAILKSQIDVLNEDYNAKNADSTRIPAAFKPFFGSMGITFRLAGTDPDGSLTTGIERRTNNIDFEGGTANKAKRTDKGGMDAWDPTKYLNLWVVEFTDDILGISVFPGDPDPLYLHGFVCDYRAFGRGASYLFPTYNQGRTTTHELGHFLNLRHIWGDANSCAVTDFPGAPTGQDDTPNQFKATYGNPDIPGTGTVLLDQCSGAGQGIMYQNYMDYSDDIALVMFTKGQMERMHTALTLSPDRSPVLQSLTYQPGGVFVRNVGARSILSPSGNIVCRNNTISPRVMVKNASTAPLTSVTVNTRLNGGAVLSNTINVNVPAGAEALLTLPAISTTTAGANNLTIYFSMPNGAADQYPANDTIRSTFIATDVVTTPLVQGFDNVGAPFPPASWTIFNPNNDFTWMQGTPGKSSTGALFIDNFNEDASNAIDDFTSHPVSLLATDSLIISFDLAHKNYPDPENYDTLSILISTDCGSTLVPVYHKWGAALATAGESANDYINPVTSDWRRERIALPPAMTASGKVIVTIRNTSRFGNNIFIDNLSIASKTPITSFRDLKLSQVVSPIGIVCDASISPRVTVSNTGLDVITSFKVGYRIGNATEIQTFTQTLTPGSNVTLTLKPATTAIGVNSITLFVSDPVSSTGTGDELKTNDTLTKLFSVPGTAAAPLTQGFDASFLPTGWAINNPDGGETWKRGIGNRSSGSVFLNTFNYVDGGQIDELYSPAISYPADVDSVKLTFDLAATFSTLTNLDTLTILATKDCGATFTTLYKKGGNELKTVAAQGTEFLPATNPEWRKETVDLSSFASQSPVMLVFRSTNHNGNNIFVDNIAVTTRTLPARLKKTGLLISPTVTTGRFSIWHYRKPESLRSVTIYSTAGQVVWQKRFFGNADSYLTVDLSGQNAGIYFVHLDYHNYKYNITERIIKR